VVWLGESSFDGGQAEYLMYCSILFFFRSEAAVFQGCFSKSMALNLARFSPFLCCRFLRPTPIHVGRDDAGLFMDAGE